MSPRTLRRGAAKGTKLRFTLSEAAKVRIGFARAKPGRRSRFVTVGSITVQGRKGSQTVAFTGRISKSRRLSPGRFKLTATPTDAAGNRGAARTAKLRVVGQ